MNKILLSVGVAIGALLSGCGDSGSTVINGTTGFCIYGITDISGIPQNGPRNGICVGSCIPAVSPSGCKRIPGGTNGMTMIISMPGQWIASAPVAQPTCQLLCSPAQPGSLESGQFVMDHVDPPAPPAPPEQP